jgi:hypothetical protein
MSLNNEERQALSQFLNQLATAPAPAKQSDADALIREAVAKQPDAAYLLVQRALLMDQALNAAKAQIAQLQVQVQSSANPGGGSFLGSNPWAAPSNGAGVPGAGNYQVPQSQPSFLSRPSTGSSFLGNVATTAAGVVAGSFLFQGIESLLGHHSSGWGGSGFGGVPPQAVAEETIINNYYDTPADQGQSQFAASDDDVLAQNDSDFDDSSSDDSSWV